MILKIKFGLALLSLILGLSSSKSFAQNMVTDVTINFIDSSKNEKKGFWIESIPFGRGEVFNHQMGFYETGRDGLWSFYDYTGNIQKTECYNRIAHDTTVTTVVTYRNNEIKQIEVYKEYNISGIDTIPITNPLTGNIEMMYVNKREKQVLSRQEFKK